MRNNDNFDFIKENSAMKALQELRQMGFDGAALDSIIQYPNKIISLVQRYAQGIGQTETLEFEVQD